MVYCVHTVQQLSLLQGTPESLDKALELSEECGSRAPELRERVKKRVVNALVKQVGCSLVTQAHTQMSIACSTLSGTQSAGDGKLVGLVMRVVSQVWH